MKIRKGQSGQSIIEYLILVFVLAVGAISLLQGIRGKMKTKLQTIDNEIRDLGKE